MNQEFESRRCMSCNQQLNSTDNFCSNCGVPLNDTSASLHNERIRTAKILTLIEAGTRVRNEEAKKQIIEMMQKLKDN